MGKLPYIIAEIGFNHEGDLSKAKEMIHAAASSGANAVKFQTFRADDIALPTSPHYAMIKSGELTLDDHSRLAQEARERGVEFLSTPFSEWAVEVLEQIGVSAYKIASMDLTNRPLLACAAGTGKPLYLSTGMGTLAEIATAVEYLGEKEATGLTLLHCVSSYPAQAKDLNLATISFMRQTFQVPVGYSDHFPGVQACLTAYMLGAEVIETHFTLDNTVAEGDHPHSATPQQVSTLISEITLFQEMTGENSLLMHRSDRDSAKDFRRGVYASRNLESGTTLEQDHLMLCRPETELGPNDLDWLIGRNLRKDVPEFTPLKREHV